MKSKRYGYVIFLLALIFTVDGSVASNCETTLVGNKLNKGHGDQIYLADCRINTKESSPLKLLPGNHAVFTAEQQIRFGPGFYAPKGSVVQTNFRPCIRNPVENTGYVSRGSAGIRNAWMKEYIDMFIVNFNTPPLTVELKYKPGTRDIPDFYRDATLTNTGKDHSLPETHGGIDEGVFHFYIGHGNPGSFHVRTGDEVLQPDGTVSVWGTDTDLRYQQEMLLGNCSSDGKQEGTLRYLWLCSCRVFAHGPRVVAWVWDEELNAFRNRDEYDRPSEFNGSSTDLTNHRNVINRWGPVLSKNMRMACGASTRAACGDNQVKDLKKNYFDDKMSVADSWGHAIAGRSTNTKGFIKAPDNTIIRDVHVTPLCIARGNVNPHEPRSPITDDDRFMNKANPYDEAWHVVSWEWDDATGTPVKQTQNMPEFLPVFITTSPQWLNNEKHVKEQMPPEGFVIHNDIFISKTTTSDGRPKLKIDTRTGAVILSGDRKPLRTDKKNPVLSLEKYASLAKDFIEKQAWQESDMDNMEALRGILQVIPSDSQVPPSQITKLQKDITFYVRRRIPLEIASPKVFGSDNVIVVQMNNDGTVKTASKRWREITKTIEGVPLQNYDKAYIEALSQLGDTGLYQMSTWDWGYKSTTDDTGQEMMIVYYFFTFEPIAAIDECISESINIEIQGHIL